MSVKRVTLGSYLLAYLALLALATLSLFLSRLAWTGDLAASLAIAAIKAALVLWIFMHLAEQRAGSRIAVAVALAWVAILVALTTLDVVTRCTFPPGAEPGPSQGFYHR